MLTLSLLRHAKSSWAIAGLDDFDRPLNARGEEAAPRMGAFMAKRGIEPELILCSSAARTRQTLGLVLARLRRKPEVVYEDALYGAAEEVLLAHIRKVPSMVRHVMVIGHDPGLHALACMLAGTGPRKDLDALVEKLPTAGLAVMAFPGRAWSEVERGAGRLKLFMTPKRLPQPRPGS